MKLRHLALALLVVAIWGFNFVVARFGLDRLPPLTLVGLRFALAGLPAVLLPRPKVPWPRFLLIGLFLFDGQFGFLFTGMKLGMPPGLASVVGQSQAFFTILIATLVLGERPSARQLAGFAVALAGLGAIITTVGSDVTWLGLALILAAGLSWAIGNVLLRRAGPVDMPAMMVWLSLVNAPLFLGLSLGLDGPATVLESVRRLDPVGIGAILYLAGAATLIGYVGWGHLVKLYPVSLVAPFSLLVPLFGAASASLIVGEHFGPARLAGAVLVVGGLAVMALPLRRPRLRWAQGRAAMAEHLSD